MARVVAELVARVREEVGGGVLEDLERSEALELQADAEYGRLVPENAYLQGVLRLRWGKIRKTAGDSTHASKRTVIPLGLAPPRGELGRAAGAN
jgi:hypothetical protein